jgi:hypothetical protein
MRTWIEGEGLNDTRVHAAKRRPLTLSLEPTTDELGADFPQTRS